MTSKALERLRTLCLALPEVIERGSRGEPAWFVRGKKTFAMFADRHSDERLAFSCAAAERGVGAVVGGLVRSASSGRFTSE